MLRARQSRYPIVMLTCKPSLAVEQYESGRWAMIIHPVLRSLKHSARTQLVERALPDLSALAQRTPKHADHQARYVVEFDPKSLECLVKSAPY